MNDILFCKEMQSIKELLAQIAGASGKTTNYYGLGSDNGNDLIVQYPESSSDISLAASGTYEKSVKINRKLKFITVSAPENCTIQIFNDNACIMWFTDEAGTQELPTGYGINELKIIVKNLSTTDPCRWSLRMIFT